MADITGRDYLCKCPQMDIGAEEQSLLRTSTMTPKQPLITCIASITHLTPVGFNTLIPFLKKTLRSPDNSVKDTCASCRPSYGLC